MPGSTRLRRDIRSANKHMRREAYRWGQQVIWYPFDPTSVEDEDSDDPGTIIDDDLYDEGGVQARPGNTGTGTSRKWGYGVPVQAYSVSLDEGAEQFSETGSYDVDRLNITVVHQMLKDSGIDTDGYRLNDRIVYNGRIFNVDFFDKDGRVADSSMVVSVRATQVMPDEQQTDDPSWHKQRPDPAPVLSDADVGGYESGYEGGY